MTAIAALKPKNRVEAFNELIDDKLNYSQRINLHKKLGHNGTNRLTRLLNPLFDNLGEFTAQEVGILSTVLNVPAHELIMIWGLGRNTITIDQANELVADDGYTWGLVNHIA